MALSKEPDPNHIRNFYVPLGMLQSSKTVLDKIHVITHFGKPSISVRWWSPIPHTSRCWFLVGSCALAWLHGNLWTTHPMPPHPWKFPGQGSWKLIIRSSLIRPYFLRGWHWGPSDSRMASMLGLRVHSWYFSGWGGLKSVWFHL